MPLMARLMRASSVVPCRPGAQGSSMPPASCSKCMQPSSSLGVCHRRATVSPEQLHGQGPIMALAVHESGAKPRESIMLLVVQEESGAVVWDAR